MFAHSMNDDGKRHDLSQHLRDVAGLAKAFSAEFGGGELAHLAGLLHDIGKSSAAFQNYLAACEREPNRRHPTVDHKGAGTLLALDHFDLAAFLVQGHHGGLPNAADLHNKIKALQRDASVREIVERARQAGFAPTLHEPPDALLPDFARHDALTVEFFLRMVFSALVDADCLDTERHFSPEKAELRLGAPTLGALATRLRAAQERISGKRDDLVNRARAEVYHASLHAASMAPGFFRLTVPTGGGKTRSGLAFALEHALLHDQHRVIVAVPFLTITDQTAQVFRDVLGDDRAVLEHHSGVVEPDDEDGSQAAAAVWRRLAVQTWDAPVIVTTMVQLLESLLGRSTSGSRKLHRLAHSVIILDEAQTLPPKLLTPILDVLQQLVQHYGATVVFCTATQPAFAESPGFAQLANVREIVPQPSRHFQALRRVRYAWPALEEAWSWERVADAMRAESQVLTIVNTRRGALALLDALADSETTPEIVHLSTLLCGAHRRDVLEFVRWRLAQDLPVRVVSTQVVEAGVDIDFPLVLRAMGPLDRIVQAAGRCNREGLLDFGSVVIFEPAEGGMPRGAYSTASDLTRNLVRFAAPDLDDPETFARYFASLFQLLDQDAEKIQPLRAEFQFKDVAEKFHLIDDDTVPVIVRYCGLPAATCQAIGLDPIDHAQKVADLLAELERATRSGSIGAPRRLMQQLQPYTVALHKNEFEKALQEGLVAEVGAGVWRWEGEYDLLRGVVARFSVEAFLV